MTKHKGTVQPAEGLYTRTMHGTRPRYTLAYSHINDYHIVDAMPVNTFRLVHAYGEGGRRYHYDVTPDTAAFVAAASIAEQAMAQAMLDASKVQPAQALEKYTIKQLEAIRKARDIMESAGCFVSHWQHAGVHDIVKAGIDAVMNAKWNRSTEEFDLCSKSEDELRYQRGEIARLTAENEALKEKVAGCDIMGLAEEQRQLRGPFHGIGTPNRAMFD